KRQPQPFGKALVKVATAIPKKLKSFFVKSSPSEKLLMGASAAGTAAVAAKVVHDKNNSPAEQN
ncbi:hypothetical protein IWQ60_009210, partial [Tieghemiomyces parasiticus]